MTGQEIEGQLAGAKNSDFVRQTSKPDEEEDGGLMSQRATLPQIEFWSLLLKGGGRVAGYCRLLSRMFCSCSPPGRFGHNVLVNVPQDNPYLL